MKIIVQYFQRDIERRKLIHLVQEQLNIWKN